jgi:hypothetical protein
MRADPPGEWTCGVNLAEAAVVDKGNPTLRSYGRATADSSSPSDPIRRDSRDDRTLFQDDMDRRPRCHTPVGTNAKRLRACRQ